MPFEPRQVAKRDGGVALWRLAMWGAVAAILLAPAIAMRFTAEVDWGPEDFAFGGALLIGAGLLMEVAAWAFRKTAHRLLAGAILLGLVLVIWADAAVGVF